MATIVNTNYFSPTQIAGCSLWVDTADVSSLFKDTAGTQPVTTNGDIVRRINDKSGNGRNATTSATTNVYTTSQSNGNSAIQVPSDSGFATPTFTLSSANTCTLFIVALQNPPISGNVALFRNNTGNNATLRIQLETTLARINVNSLFISSSLMITRLGFPNIYSVGFDSSAISSFFNGTSASSGQSGTSDGSLASPTTYAFATNTGMNGFLYEVILYNTNLTLTQRQQVEGYLAWKWGLQANLPTTHPYFYNPMIPNLILPAPLANPLTTTNTTLITLNPTQIAGCALWLDAADANSVSVTAGNVTAWRDKSGSGYIITATSGSQPTYTINTISFNGSQFFSTNYTSFPAAESIFIIVNQSVAVGEGNFIHPNQIGGRQLFINVSSNLETAKASQISLLSAGTISINNRILIETTNTGTSLNHFINGINQGSTTVTAYSGSLATTTIGARSSGSSAITGSINEIVIFNSALSTAQRQQIEGYLAWKWGLQASLQITHPYYYNPLIPNLILPSQVYSLAPSFSPSRFSGLGLWLDAADSASVVTSGSVVTGWRDKSTSNNSSTGVTGTVTYNSNLLNFGGGTGSSYVSIPSIAFSTTNMTFFIYLKFTSTFTYPTDANYYYVDFFNAIGATQMIYGMVRFNSSPYNWVINNYTAGGATNGQGLFYTGVGGPTGTSYIITIVTNGSTYTQYLNGNLINTTTSTSFVPTTPASFRIGTGANGMNIGEIAFFQNTTLTTNQRQQIEGYLAWKWGLQTSLPANHPYFLYPPS